MGLPRPEKFERARQIAGCLGYVGLTDQHHVRASWVGPGARVSASPWFHHRSDLFRMVELSAAVRPRGRMPLADWMERAVLALKMRGGQAIVITDGMMPPADFFRAMHYLLVRNMDVRVIQVLTPEELRPGALFQGGQVVDAETGQTHQLAYSAAELAQAVTAHNELLARFCKRNGIPFAQDRLEAPLETFVTKTLPAHGFLE
jgi:hypothetical protein